MRIVSHFDLNFTSYASLSEVAQEVINRSQFGAGELPLLITPNVDQLVKLDRAVNHTLKQILSKAAWILPDGQPIVTLSKLKLGREGILCRLTGSDFFPVIWTALLPLNYSSYFILPQDSLGELFIKEKPGSRYHTPPFFDENDEHTINAIAQRVVDAYLQHPIDYIFIGLGFPKQEKISLAIIERFRLAGYRLPKILLLGASFEFYWGIKKRAPKIFKQLGIEFVHRLFSEPRRMFKRYLIDDSVFISLAYRELKRKNK